MNKHNYEIFYFLGQLTANFSNMNDLLKKGICIKTKLIDCENALSRFKDKFISGIEGEKNV